LLWLSFLIHALPHAALNLGELIDRVSIHISGEMVPNAKIPTVERARPAGALSFNGATVSVENMQVFLEQH